MKSMEERFWEKVSIKEPNECWEWQAFTYKGYGKFRLKGKSEFAHRVSYELAHGPIPEGLVVRHKCDNPRCCNPAHLEEGTHQDNMDDRTERNRHGMAKLTPDDVRSIYLDERSQTTIAKQYGITQGAVGNIKHGRRWSHITNNL